MLQTGARLIWDIEFGKVLSLAPDVPLDVRLEYEGPKWAVKTSQVNVVTKSYDDRIHSSGSSSRNAVTPLPNLDVRQTLAKFPLIDTHGESTVIVKWAQLTYFPGFYGLIERLAAFGPQFQRLKKLRGNAHEGVATISVPNVSDR